MKKPLKSKRSINRILSNEKSVRETEKMVDGLKKQKNHKIIEEEIIDHFSCNNWSKKLTDVLSTNVKVRLNSKGIGKIIIHVDSEEIMESIVGRLHG